MSSANDRARQQIIDALSDLVPADEAEAYCTQIPQPEFGDRTLMQLVDDGRIDVALAFVEHIRHGGFA